MPTPDSTSADEKAAAAYREAQSHIAKAVRDGRKVLDLTELGLTCVPPEIGMIATLEVLGLFGNQLTSVPPEIGQLANLTRLDLSSNQLTSVPPEIGQLSKLTLLALNSNQLTSLPPALRQLSKLHWFYLSENRKLKLPASVVNAQPKPGPILDYYFRMRAKSDRLPLCEGKLILVGRGDVGKTSLVRRLIDNSFSRREDTTQGIRIRKLEVVAGRKKDQIQMHVWDFGGQEIMHATHQLFLTDRSLYLVVLDGRAGQQEAEADYWLRLIASFAPKSPVLVVLNKIKKDHFALNRAALQQKFPQVVGFFETDCDNPGRDKQPGKNGHGIEELRKAIAQQVDKLDDIRAPFPNSWFAIKDELSKPRRKNFITFDEYRALCTEHGEDNAESQDNLSLFLHRLGIALNFRDEPRLHDKHVLNPHWLTTGIYKLLNSKTLAARKGELTPADLQKELDAKQYPVEMHPFLINLMEKFELCFSFEETSGTASAVRSTRANAGDLRRAGLQARPSPDAQHGRAGRPALHANQPTTPLASKYLIPELLDPEQPAAASDFNDAKCLNFLYRYPVLPPGYLPRFIVRTHVLSEEHRWKTGVILNFEGNTALVKADPQDKTIRILINGPVAGRRRMLAVIRQDFEVIHRDAPHLQPDELVSFPNAPQITVSYDELEVLYADDPNTIIKRVIDGQVLKSTARELLEGVEFAPLSSTRRTKAGKTRRDRKMATGSASEFESGKLRVFYSYARVDKRQREKQGKHLSPLERLDLIETWYDNEILPGDDFSQEIADKLAAADIVLLLISPDFVHSKYCYEIELPKAMARQAKNQARVIPVVIRSTNAWEKLPAGKLILGKLNALPSSAKAVPKWRPQDDGWADIAAGIERVANDLLKQRTK